MEKVKHNKKYWVGLGLLLGGAAMLLIAYICFFTSLSTDLFSITLPIVDLFFPASCILISAGGVTLLVFSNLATKSKFNAALGILISSCILVIGFLIWVLVVLFQESRYAYYDNFTSPFIFIIPLCSVCIIGVVGIILYCKKK